MFKAKRAIFLTLVVSILSAFLLVSSDEKEGHPVIITGMVKDEAGKPLPRMPVVLVLERVRFKGRGIPPEVVEEKTISTTTDGDGFYRLAAIIEPKFNRILLRFYSEQGFDKVRYAIPKEMNITWRAKRRSELRLDKVIKENPLWEKVKVLIARYGYRSPKGRVLRTRGLPDKTEKGNRGKCELWWYYEEGVCYRFRGEKLERVFKFNPIKKEGPPKPKEKGESEVL